MSSMGRSAIAYTERIDACRDSVQDTVRPPRTTDGCASGNVGFAHDAVDGTPEDLSGIRADQGTQLHDDFAVIRVMLGLDSNLRCVFLIIRSKDHRMRPVIGASGPHADVDAVTARVPST